MITTVTLNPCIDKTIVINKLVHKGLNKIVSAREDLGGKGINVSMALKNFGEETFVIGLDFSKNNYIISKLLEDKNIKKDLIRIDGRLRTNIKIFEEHTKEMTEFNETGFYIEKNDVKRVIEAIKNKAKETNILVLSGSVCPGFDDNIYSEIIQKVRKENQNLKIILDASGEKLLKGMQQKPNLIKPNLFELEESFKTKLNSHKEIIELCKKIISSGIETVCVSMGKDGAVIVSEKESYLADSLNLNIKSAQGAGDSMIAGLCYGIKKGALLDELLRYGIGASASTVILEGTQMGNYNEFMDMSKKACVKKIQ